jgi:hypothetical protein
MQLNIHRHPDGSIDFEFYRRAASRQRQLARRLLFRRFLSMSALSLGATTRRVGHAISDFWDVPMIRLSDFFR